MYRYFITSLVFLLIAIPAQAMDEITIQLKWLHQFQFAGYYAAKEKGYFAEEGLDVTLNQRNVKRSQIDDVIEGRAEYGVSDAGLVLSRMKGKPVVLLAQYFQHSPLVLIALRESGIKTAYDLKNKRVMSDLGSDGNASLLAMIQKTLGSIEQIISIPQNFKKEVLVEKSVEAISGYISSQPYWFEQHQKEIILIDPRDYGIDFYGDNLFTSEAEIEQHPDRVEKVIRAVTRGWEFALKHPEEIIDMIMEKYHTQKQTRDHLRYEAKKISEMMLAEFVDIGVYEESRYIKMGETYAQLGFIDHTKVDAAFFYVQHQRKQNLLTTREIDWIKRNQQVLFTGDPNWLPYEAFTDDGNYIGIVADHLKLVEKKTGLKFKPVPVKKWTEALHLASQREVPVISGDAADTILNGLFKPIDTYSQNPIVIIMDYRSNYVDSLDEIKDKKIAIIKDYGYTSDIFKHFPEHRFIEVENIQQGLEGVANGKFDAMLATMALASYHIAEMGLHNIRVVGKTPIIMDLTLFIVKTEPILHSIINKAFKDISSAQSHQILQRWIKREYVETTDYRLMIEVITGMLFIMIWIFIWNRRLKREINLRKTSEKELDYLASHDALTGLYNRMRFEQLIKQEIKRAQRYKHSVSLFLIDIDHFKQINDTYGHRVGDRTLKSFSKLLVESIRSTDHAARYGGEEFIVLLPETDNSVAKELAERLQKKVSNHHFSTEEIENLKFTISIGVSSYPDSADTWEMLIHNSDSAMYTAKREGRNQVRVA